MDENKLPSSSISCYRQPAASSVSVIHQVTSPSHGVVIPMEQFNVMCVPSDNHQPPDYTSDQSSLFNRLVEEKSIGELIEHGGVEGVATSLKTHLQNGIEGSSRDIESRREFFGTNAYPARPNTKSLFRCVLKEFKDVTILILLGCAALSLGFGIKQHGAREGWYDGASIFAAIFLVISISATSNFRQNMKFDHLFEVNNNVLVVVVRNGRRQQISIFEIVVGDIVCLNIGDQVPADGLFIEGHSLKVDESRMTRERDHVEINRDQNPFLPSGAKIADGCAMMLVTAVGMNTSWGKMMSTISRDSNEQTPLHERSHQLTLILSKVGLAVAFLVLVMLLVCYFTGKTRDENGNKGFLGSRTKVDDIINSVVDIIATAVVIVVVAIPEGLPLAISLTLAYSIKRMMADQAMVRNLSACELMASATTICTDMKRIIASNQMRVPRFFVGKDSMEGRSYTSVAAKVLELFFQGIRHTSARVHNFFPVTPVDETIWSWAIIRWNMEMENIKQFSILNVKASYSESWKIGISLKNQLDNTIHLHWKGDADKIFPLCSYYYDSDGNTIALSNVERETILHIIVNMASSRLRCIAFAHRQLSEGEYENQTANQEIPDSDLILLGLVGVEDQCSPGIREAIDICQRAGVHVKLITSENVSRARAIVLECGILSAGQEANEGSVVEAQEFFNYTNDQQKDRVGDIRVMAMSSDDHKLQMVRLLKEKGHVVAVTGDGPNDAPTLKEADIGLAMGVQSTEVAKESSDIVILDGNFGNVVKVVRWGRCIYNNIQKFIQFQLTVNVAALVINLVSVVSSGKAPLTIAQLLWVNLIMDTLGALALATEKPTEELMIKPPVHLADPLITNIMLRNIIGQALYQIAVALTLKFKGESIFGVHEEVIDTHIFNTFVLCQVFNQFNARRLEKKNVFEGILKNKLFIGITGVTIILQGILVEFLNKFAHTERLNWKQWAACIGIAAFSWPVGWLIKCIPVPKTPIFSLLS
ncbi:hypothetical protein Pfo_007937 [Paulownia fortunei]|nr:hypothetical protein Pfo_007937 [Paulownia fortunei]